MSENKPRLNGFEFLQCLGRGAFGEVWLVRDLTLDTLRAVKIVALDMFSEQKVRGLIAEAQAVARLPNHRNWVIVHQIEDGITNCFLVLGRHGAVNFSTLPVPPDQWFMLEVIAEGNRVVVKVNGQMAADYPDPERRFARGHITLFPVNREHLRTRSPRGP
jgi:serine/threonine protein kinase